MNPLTRRPQSTNNAPGASLITSDEEMMEVIEQALALPAKQHMHLQLQDVDPADVFRLNDEKVDRQGKVVDGVTVHEAMATTFRRTLASTVGQHTRAQLYDAVMAGLHDMQKTITEQQPGEWEPIGVQFRLQTAERLVREVNPSADARTYGETNPKGPSAQMTVPHRRAGEWLVYTIAWWERSGAPPHNFLLAERNIKASPITRYAETRQIAHMPAHNRRLRAEAYQVHLKTWADREDRELPRPLTPAEEAIVGGTARQTPGNALPVPADPSPKRRQPRAAQ